jgi:hypothetical protein
MRNVSGAIGPATRRKERATAGRSPRWPENGRAISSTGYRRGETWPVPATYRTLLNVLPHATGSSEAKFRNEQSQFVRQHTERLTERSARGRRWRERTVPTTRVPGLSLFEDSLTC